MSAEFQASSSGDTISLAGRLDFSTASQALQVVDELLSSAREDGSRHSTISMAEVTHSNSAALALMIEWLAIADRNNQQLTFTHIPDSLHQISTVCQVDSLI